MVEKYDSGQNITIIKIYYQDYRVILLKVENNFQNNENINIICILVKRNNQFKALTQTWII